MAPASLAPEPAGLVASAWRLALGLAARAWGRTITGTHLWRVGVRGENCLLETEDGALEAYRFSATRWVRAPRRIAAERAGLALVTAELEQHGVRVGDAPEEAHVRVVEVVEAAWPEERLAPGRAMAWFREGTAED